jgi:hypothetical protein
MNDVTHETAAVSSRYTHCNAKLLKPSEEVVAHRYLLLALLRAQRLYLQAHVVDLGMEGIGGRR